VDAPDLSAIVLCYRAGDSILAVVAPLYEQLREAQLRFELILVANHDRDREDQTPRTAELFAESHENVRVLTHPKQGAMGWDMRSGLDAAAGRYMIVIDGDAQNPIEDVLRMYWEMRRTGAAVMKGRRTSRFDGTYRRIVSWFYNALFLLLFRTRGLWDINGKPKGLTRAAFERIELSSDDWFIDAEIVLDARRAGLTVVEMPVVFNRNEERASLVHASAIVEFIRNMIRTRLRMR